MITTQSIENLVERIIDYRGKTPPKSDSGIHLVTAKVIKDGFIQNEKKEFVSEETYNSWMKRGFPEQWDILLTSEAPLGEVAQIRTSEKIALAQRVILLRGNPQIVNQQYLFHALKSSIVQARLYARSTGTTVLGIKQSELRQVQVPIPPLPTQQKIAAILSAYDDLIENNNRRIKILEEMAQLIYKEWFVNFRFPGHEKVKIVDSPIGQIPEGWAVSTIEESAQLLYGKALKSSERKAGNIPVYGSSGIVGYHDKPLADGPGIIVGRKGNVGAVIWANTDFYPIDTVFFVRTHYSLHYVYHNFQQQNFINSDAAVPGLSRKQAYSLPFLIPDQTVLDRFDDISQSLFTSIVYLNDKNTNLCQTRDLLLPKLISGELDVSELDIDIGDEAA